MSKITVVIITRNEGHRLRRALGSVRELADEIVVVDDMSTDKTCAIARDEFGAKVFSRASEGDLSRQRNFGADQASSPWILIMDADEIFSAKAVQKIREVVMSPGGHVAFEMRRLNHFMGKPLRYAGAHGTYVLRFYQKNKVRYREPGVHHEWDVNGTMGRIHTDIHHYPFDSATQIVQRALCYSEYDAETYLRENPTVSIREIRYRLVSKSVKNFIKLYVRKFGFLDGMTGFVWAVCNTIGPQIRWIRIWEKAHKAGRLVP